MVITMRMIILIIMAGCIFIVPGGGQADGMPIRIAVTVPGIGDVVRRVGGDAAKVRIILPSGADPGSYFSDPSSLEPLALIDLLVVSGAEFEAEWLDLVRKEYPDIRIIEPGFGEYPNGYPWMSPRVMGETVEDLVTVLGEIDPQRRSLYRAAGDLVLGDIEQLDFYLREKFGKSQQRRTFFTSNDSWEPLALEYGLVQIVAWPEGKSFQGSLKRAKKVGVQVILVEKGRPMKRISTLAVALDADMAMCDPFSNDWFAMMRRTAALIGTCLR